MSNTTNAIPYPQTIVAADAICTAAKTTETDLTNAVLLYTAPANAPALVTRLTANRVEQDGVGQVGFGRLRSRRHLHSCGWGVF